MKSFGIPFRQRSKVRTAIVFIHGFSGDAAKTWGRFPQLLMRVKNLAGWDIWSVGFATSLFPEIRGLWKADPGIDLIATELRTRCSHGKLAQYDRHVFVAHSMGGLVVQRALVDAPDELGSRVDKLFLFGTPSLGLLKARIFRLLKLSVSDMAQSGPFIQSLRKGWSAAFPNGEQPFRLFAVAGSQDQFVPPSSSLAAFALDTHFGVPGSHTSMVKPDRLDAEPVLLVTKGIIGDPSVPGAWTTDQEAIERGDHARVIRALSPREAELDDDRLVELALAFDASGKPDRARRVLESRPQLGTDALGTLAGRYKRRWRLDGTKQDGERAHELYAVALQRAVDSDDADQVLYQAINVAFLELAFKKRLGACKAFAQQALAACDQANQGRWTEATRGEAYLYLGDAELAAHHYSRALALRPSPREIESMHMQATLAERLTLGRDSAQVEHVFSRFDP